MLCISHESFLQSSLRECMIMLHIQRSTTDTTAVEDFRGLQPARDPAEMGLGATLPHSKMVVVRGQPPQNEA